MSFVSSARDFLSRKKETKIVKSGTVWHKILLKGTKGANFADLWSGTLQSGLFRGIIWQQINICLHPMLINIVWDRVGYSGGRQEKSSQEILTSHRKFWWKFTHFVAFLKEVQVHVTRKISYQSKTFMFIEW